MIWGANCCAGQARGLRVDLTCLAACMYSGSLAYLALDRTASERKKKGGVR